MRPDSGHVPDPFARGPNRAHDRARTPERALGAMYARIAKGCADRAMRRAQTSHAQSAVAAGRWPCDAVIVAEAIPPFGDEPETTPMTATKPALNWIKLSDAALSPEARAAQAAMRTPYDTFKASRDAFESQVATDVAVPASKRLVFSYRYGVSVALDNATAAKATKPAAKTLADLLNLG